MAATPPAFNPAQRQRSSKNIWVWLILAVVFFCILLGVGFFFLMKSLLSTAMIMMACAVNGELATNAVLAYAMEHDGQLPNAETWQTDVMPYYERLYDKRGDIFEGADMPDMISVDAAKPGSVIYCNPAGQNETGFAFNVELSGMNLSEIGDVHDTILIWETTTPKLNAFGDPSVRNDDDPALKLWGDTRGWMNYMASGDLNSGAEGNVDMDLDFDFDPEDGLEESPVEATEDTSRDTPD
ncbi:MAG: hypothetical protein IIC73_05875 [Armatimonadetes bacterium]|nr:hypothetical protein [Armatimonadota bacterium]